MKNKEKRGESPFTVNCAKQLFGSGKLHRLSYEWIVVVGNLAVLFEGNKSEHEGPRNLDVIAVKDSVNMSCRDCTHCSQ